ncbi:MAG: TolC family protein [Longimicrobiales bacterium]|nr:TolC family protein [Longimicrobiales bacterium]
MTKAPLLAPLLLCAVLLPSLLSAQVGSEAGSTPTDTVRLSLGDVLESALRTHPTVAGAEAHRRASAAWVAEARSAWLPTVAASALARRHQEPMVVAPLHGFSLQSPPAFDETLYQGHASVDYALFDGARAARVRAASAVESSLEAGVAVAREAVLAEVTSAYLGAMTARDVLRAQRLRVTALEEEGERAALLFREGRAPRLAVLRAEAALSRARAEREAAVEELALALRRLARVSGLEDARVRDATLVALAPDDGPPPPRAALVDRARAVDNPALARAADRVAATESRVSAAKSSFLPRVSLTGRYSAFGAPSVDFTGEWQAGVQLSYPLFTGGARVAAVERARADAEAARAERQLVERRLVDAVDAGLSAYRTARARTEALEAAVTQGEEVARIEALALASGAGVQTDYLRAEAELAEVRSALAQARHAAVEARVGLARATGTLTMEWLEQWTERAGP